METSFETFFFSEQSEAYCYRIIHICSYVGTLLLVHALTSNKHVLIFNCLMVIYIATLLSHNLDKQEIFSLDVLYLLKITTSILVCTDDVWKHIIRIGFYGNPVW